MALAVAFSTNYAMAQRSAEVVHLKNGSLIKGEIIEQVPNQSVKLKTKDGNVFVYQMDEIEKITVEKNQSGEQHKGLDFIGSAGYDINTKGGGGAVAIEVEAGKRFVKNFYWGIGAGVDKGTAEGSSVTIPVTTNVKAYFPLQNSAISPFVMLKAGYAFNTDDMDYNAFLLSIMPGVQFPLSNTIDMYLGAGYTHMINKNDNAGAVSVRLGFGFHNSPGYVPKPLEPSTERTYQLTAELNPADTDHGEFLHGGNLVFSYKKTQLLAIGVGLGYAKLPQTKGSISMAFVRGQYRLTDRRLSPFASVDLGAQLSRFTNWRDDDKKTKVGPFIAPSVGLSLRSSKNSYVDLAIGYHISGKVTFETLNEHDYEEKISTSKPFLKVGFTRTLAR